MTTDCEALRQGLFEALDREPTGAFRSHLSSCPACRDELEEARRFERSLRPAGVGPSVSPTLEVRMRRLEARAAREGAQRGGRRSTAAVLSRRVMGALAASILFAIVLGLLPDSADRSPTPRPPGEIPVSIFSPTRSGEPGAPFHLLLRADRAGYYYALHFDGQEPAWLFPLDDPTRGADSLGHPDHFFPDDPEGESVFVPALDYGAFELEAAGPEWVAVVRAEAPLSDAERAALLGQLDLRLRESTAADPSGRAQIWFDALTRRFPGATLVPLSR